MSGRVIHVVDDDSAIRFILEAFLTEQGFQVVESVTLDDALAHIHQAPPDVMLLGVGWNGGKMRDLDLMRTAAPGVPVIALIPFTHRTPRITDRALQSGAVECIVKPFELSDELLRPIRRALGSEPAR